MKLVSIIINNYNYGRYLQVALDSALGQTHSPCEVIVVDDGSTDDSHRVIDSYGDQVTSVKKQNGGQASAMNLGFARSKGDYILFLDADDQLELNCVEVCLSAVEADTARLVYGMNYIDEHSKISRRNRDTAATTGKSHGFLDVENGKMQAFAGSPTSSNFFSRGALDKIMPIEPEARFAICADQFLFLNSVAVGKVSQIPDKLVRYRVHGRNHFSVRNLTGRAVERRLKNIVNRAYLKEQLYGRGPREWSKGEYIKGWEDFETVLLSKKLPAEPTTLAQIDVEWVETCLREELAKARRTRRWSQWVMLSYVYMIPNIPLKMTCAVGTMIRRLKYL